MRYFDETSYIVRSHVVDVPFDTLAIVKFLFFPFPWQQVELSAFSGYGTCPDHNSETMKDILTKLSILLDPMM